MFKLRYSWRLFFASFPEILCFAFKKNCSTSVKLPSVKSHPVYFLNKNFLFNKNLKYSRNLTFYGYGHYHVTSHFLEKKIEQNLFFDHDLSVTYGSLSAHPWTCSASGTLKLWAVNSHVLSIPSSNAMWKIPHRRKFFGNPFPFLRTFGCRDIRCT